MNPWITHKRGVGPVVVAPVLGVHDVVACVRATAVAHCRVDGLKLLLNRMLCTRPLAIHSATGLAGRDEIRGTSVGAGNDSAGSFAAPNSA